MSDFARMLEHEIPRLRRYARALTRDPVRADDLPQDTLVRALTKKHLWQPGTNLRHWLFAILHNQRVSNLRALAREQRVFAAERADSGSVVAPGFDARIVLLELARAIAALPEARRQIVGLVGLEGMSYGEVADLLGVPTGIVSSRLARARKTLRNAFLAEKHIAKPVLADGDARHERIAA
jgi:RNA polymerase sigma-70 factor (ECF subfamily)